MLIEEQGKIKQLVKIIKEKDNQLQQISVLTEQIQILEQQNQKLQTLLQKEKEQAKDLTIELLRRDRQIFKLNEQIANTPQFRRSFFPKN
ncbi:hypothetical protein RFI_16088 [Reticulomyxa filosa]|uniref:Uncharacterized protein n=1 Tax=Reticulomyxa filosa TaxID=46433 RepID=X6N591_RETFI|nr:hypothetical protein RFI_16088 [Reticulomyxa filosa]|eukprot:ETO21113.1 hypothetical protein RFI_16088 [Reticulomyxa filosa]